VPSDFDILVIAGPTASGKTGVGIALAQALNGEIISADARQIYRHMDIGTAKPTAEEQSQAIHHLIDFVDPNESYSAGKFAEDAHQVVTKIVHRGKIPIFVGGAGLYLRSYFDGFAPMPEIQEGIREALIQSAEQNLCELYRELQRVDSVWAGKIQSTDRQRIIRGLEVFQSTGKTLTHYQSLPPEPLGGHWQTRWFALDWPREVLYERINQRAGKMVADGLVEEVEALTRLGYSLELNALKTFGYREFFEYLAGRLSLEDAIAELQQGSRRYAKRQLTWFRGEEKMTWIDSYKRDPGTEILKQLGA